MGERVHRGTNGTWTTADEMEHLAGLGGYHTASHKVSRLVWLQRYTDAMPLRADWGKIDRGAVTVEVERLQRLEQQRLSRHGALGA